MSWGKATAVPSQITDLIFIGSNRHAADLASANPEGIAAVLNVGDRRLYKQEKSVEYKRVRLEDPGPISQDDFNSCVDFIKTHTERGNRILVHCNAGRNRSTAIVIGFLLTTGQLSRWTTAFKYVKSKRGCVGCNSVVKKSVIANLSANEETTHSAVKPNLSARAAPTPRR
jgi:protein-tyrosine phosphatase